MRTPPMWALLPLLIFFMWVLQLGNRDLQKTALPPQPVELALPALDDEAYDWIGAGIFQNETGGQADKLTYWGAGEDFPSLGIGHFIWFPAAVDAPFDEQFPAMVAFVSGHAPATLQLPAWLKTLTPFDAPWTSKEAFDAAWSSSEMAALRQWLLATRQYQARFIVSAFQQRWQALELPGEQKRVFTTMLETLAATPEGLFAVIDYYNFKGLGNNPRERYQGQGWGLLQVLQAMLDAPPPAGACDDAVRRFRDAAVSRLRLRVELSPPARNESRWLPGWERRLDDYLDGNSMARRVSGCGFRVRPYLQNPAVDAMTISWLGNDNAPGKLRIWQQGDEVMAASLESSPLPADALGYHPEENCQASYCAAARLPFLHQVRLTGLTPDSTYRYEVSLGADKAGGVFTTPGPAADRLRFIVYADSETEPESTGKHACWPGDDLLSAARLYPVDQTTGYAQNLAVINDRQPAFVAIAGDLVQSGGEQRDWDEFWRHNEKLAANVAILPALGNHDYFGGPGALGRYGTDDSERSVRKYLSYFDLPDNGVADKRHQERFYSLSHGPLTLIVMDPTDGLPHMSEQDPNWYLRGENDGGYAPDWHPGSVQYQWLEKQLGNAQANSAFTFVMFHAAPYTSGVHGQTPGQGNGEDPLSSVPLKALTPLFMQYGVDAVFSGHDEMYEHSVVSGLETNSDGSRQPNQIHFLDVGIGGDGLRGPVSGVENPERVFLAHVDAPEVYDTDGVLRDGGKHYGHLEVNLQRLEDGRWRGQFDPVYIFPLLDQQGQVIQFERRLYDDAFTLFSKKVE